jgi:hypothetical protein
VQLVVAQSGVHAVMPEAGVEVLAGGVAHDDVVAVPGVTFSISRSASRCPTGPSDGPPSSPKSANGLELPSVTVRSSLKSPDRFE